MHVDRRAAGLGTATGATGPLGSAAVLWLVDALPFRLLYGPTPVPSFEAWVDLLVWGTVPVLFGPMVVVAVCSFGLALPSDRRTPPLVLGFLPGGLLHGLGSAFIYVLDPNATLMVGVSETRVGTWLAVGFVAAAAVGAVGGDAVGTLVRYSPEETHPRW